MSEPGQTAVTGVTTVPDDELGNRTYLVDLGDGRALVVDPARDPSPYLAAAGRLGLSIAYSAETHLHADFLPGSRELAARGARVPAPAAGRIEHPHRGLHDEEDVDLGGLTVRVLATPGHTPEHLGELEGEVDAWRAAGLATATVRLLAATAQPATWSERRTSSWAPCRRRQRTSRENRSRPTAVMASGR